MRIRHTHTHTTFLIYSTRFFRDDSSSFSFFADLIFLCFDFEKLVTLFADDDSDDECESGDFTYDFLFFKCTKFTANKNNNNNELD